MSKNWTETTLGEIAKWGSGGTPKSDNPSYYDGDIPWCVIGDLTEGEVRITEKCISVEGLRNSSAKMVEPGAVMIAMYGASIGRTGIVAVPMATNQAIAFAYVDESKVVNHFLLIYLQVQKQKFIVAGQGAAQPNISQTVLKDWPILLPSLKEQKRIVDVVSSVDTYIDALQMQVESARTARNAVLHDLLTSVGDDWTETTLGEIASWSSGKNLSSDKRNETGLFPILGANGVIGRTNEILLDEELITVGRVGACGETHRSTGPVWISDNALIVIPKEQVTVDLLFYILSTFNYQSIISGTTQPLITQSKMKSQVVNLPPLNEQKRIVEIVSSMDEVIQSTEQAVVDARNLRSGLLSDLLSGNHEIPASYDSLLGAA